MNHYGKQPFVPDHRDLRWADVKPSGLAVPTIPKPHGGFGMDFTDWLMLGNGPSGAFPAGWAARDGCGNCTIVDKLHSLMESAKNAGRPVPIFTDWLAVADYRTVQAFSGGPEYDPHWGSNDTGLMIRDVLRFGQKVGFGDAAGVVHTIGPYVAVQPGNFQEMWEILWFCEHLSMGIQAPESMQQQVQAGETITYVPGSPIEGGHDILLTGHPAAGIWTGVQWGQRTPMTPEFITHQADEMWGWFDPLQISAVTGKSYDGFDPALLQEYLALAARQFPV